MQKSKQMKRVFVRGISRSGGTLMVTILDAHPDLAMTYETYEHLLSPISPSKDHLEAAINCIDNRVSKKGIYPKLKDKFLPKAFSTSSSLDSKKFLLFADRAERAGVNSSCLHEALLKHKKANLTFDSFKHRMQFVEQVALIKAVHEEKSGWGAKLLGKYQETIDLWPDAKILFMLRDGRDIAASRTSKGSFDQTIGEIASGYVSQINKFEKFTSKYPTSGYLVNYESLVRNPEVELRSIVSFLGLQWSDHLLKHDEMNLSIFSNPKGHLSRDQVNKPINNASIGRWKTNLSHSEVLEFESIAGETLMRHGYSLSS